MNTQEYCVKYDFVAPLKGVLPLFALVTVVEVAVVVVVVAILRGFTSESFPIKPLNVAHMITDVALP